MDIKRAKKELLDAFNSQGARPDAVAREDALDGALSLWFAEAAHLPRPMIFEAIVNSLALLPHDRALQRPAVKSVLDRIG